VLDENDKSPAKPSAPEVRAQLERILASRCFEQAGRASRFLRYAVEQTLAGHGERLKGYTIAVEVFDRPADFDAQNDSLVRVEGGRLRRRLIEYYATEGRSDRVQIELPRGSYAVVWSYDSSGGAAAADAERLAPPAGEVTTQPARTTFWRQASALLLAAAILVTLAIVILRQPESSERARDYPTFAEALAQGRPPIVVVPFEVLDNQARSRSLAETLTEEVLIELDEHELFVIATEPRSDAADRAAARASAGSTGYVLSGSVRTLPDTIRITARVVLAATGTQIWSTRFDEPRSIETARAEQERVARAIAAVAAPYGPVFDAELTRVAAAPPERRSLSECMLDYYEYRRDLDAARHAVALRCIERVIQDEPESATAWATLSLLLTEAFGFAYDSADATGAATLDRAREAARTAMDIDGENVFANLALARVQFFSRVEFRGTAEQVLARRPNNTEVLSLVGAMLVNAGDVARGRALFERAIELSPRPPPTYYGGLAFARLASREYDEALAAALRMDSPNWVSGNAILASAAALAGREDIAVRARDRQRELSATQGQDPRVVLARWPMHEALRSELLRGLEAAERIGAQ
jgi:TolB-like protein